MNKILVISTGWHFSSHFYEKMVQSYSFKSAVLNGMTYADNNWERGISFPGYKFYMSSIQAKIIMNNFENLIKK